MLFRLLFVLPLLALAACGGRPGEGVVRIEGPDLEPRRVAIRTLEPGPTPTPTPSPTPTPTPAPPTPTPQPVPAPAGATLTSEFGTQAGAVASFCWSEHVGGPARCQNHPEPSQAEALPTRPGEVVLVRIDAQIPPNDQSVRPFQESRSGYPSHRIDPTLETELTIDLPEGLWSMDLCATWHGRGQPICWLFSLDVSG